MRSTVLVLVLALGFATTASAEPRTIVLEFGGGRVNQLPPAEPQVTYLPQEAQPQPITVPAQPAPPPLSVPAGSPPPAVGEPSGFCPLDCCADGSYLWLGVEYLYWWVRGQPLPPLVTQSPLATPRAASGVLGQPDTTVLVGGRDVNTDARSGVRFRTGFWIDECHTFGAQASYFTVGSQESVRAVAVDPTRQTGRPFVDALTGQPSSQLVTFPGLVSGAVSVTARNNGLRGASVMLRENCYGAGNHCLGSWMRLDVLAGYAFFGIEEGLSVREDLVSTDPAGPIPVGTQIVVRDSFHTRSEFNGGQFGLSAQRRWGMFTLQADGLIALGASSLTAQIEGTRTTTAPGSGPTTAPGGLLTQVSNVGLYRRDRFAVVPQVGVKLACHLSNHAQFTLGYNFLYWSSVVRPGDQIDPVVNPNLIPPPLPRGPSRPSFTFRESDLWAQGLTAGLEFSY